MIINDTIIKKKRTDGTAHMILDLVKGMELSSLLSDIFMYTNDPVAKELIKRYEFQLISAVEEPEEFRKNLHMFYQNTASYIKKNQLFKEFYSFCYFVFSTLSAKKHEQDHVIAFSRSLNCYYNILFQQVNYFVPHPKLVYGLTTKGKLLLCDEPFPNLDVAIMSLEDKKNVTHVDLYMKYKKFGYNINSEQEFHYYQTNDQLITNMLLVMAYFINENTLNIHPKEFCMIAGGCIFPRAKAETKIYKETLNEKRYFLPKKGLVARYTNCLDIKEIYFQEVFTENRIVLLYKVTTKDDKEFNGFYDNKLELFYSPWDATDYGLTYHQLIENFVLETYCYLTTDIDEKIKEMKIEKRLYLNNEVPVINTKSIPTVEFLYDDRPEEVNTGSKKKKNKESVSLRSYDKRSYQEERVTIHPFVRRLPKGAEASPEAIELAKSYHFVLREGETFVRPFERTSYRKEK